MNNAIKLLPNLITFLRLLGIPVIVIWLQYAPKSQLIWVGVSFLFLSITDFLDGWLARRLDAVSDFGKLLDPLVDKLLILVPLIYLVGLRSEVTSDPWVPAWMVALVLAREFWITGLRGLAASRGQVIAAGDLGKVKTCFQIGAVFFLILHQQKIFRIGEDWMDGYYLGIQFLMASIFLGYWSAFEYTYKVFAEVESEFEREV